VQCRYSVEQSMEQNGDHPDVQTIAERLVALPPTDLRREAKLLRKAHQAGDLLGGEEAQLEGLQGVEHAEGVGAGIVHLEHGVQIASLLEHAAGA
jgi:hypothetical protein